MPPPEGAGKQLQVLISLVRRSSQAWETYILILLQVEERQRAVRGSYILEVDCDPLYTYEAFEDVKWLYLTYYLLQRVHINPANDRKRSKESGARSLAC